MDRKSLIGFIVIGVILFGFSWYNANQQSEYSEQKAQADSLAAVQQIELMESQPQPIAVGADSLSFAGMDTTATAANEAQSRLGGMLYAASQGSDQLYTVENEVMKISFAKRGGRVASVELKDYTTYAGSPLVLFPAESSLFNLSFFINQHFGTYQINTADYYFTPIAQQPSVDAAGVQQFQMRLPIDSSSHVAYIYTIQPDNYKIDFDVRFVGMNGVMSQSQSEVELVWRNEGLQNEKGFENENNYTTIAYNYPGEAGIEELGMSKESKSETIDTKMKWVAFKQQFFSSILVADEDFQGGEVAYNTFAPGSGKVKAFTAELSLPFAPHTDGYDLSFYFGPNQYTTLKKYDLHFEHLIPLGWGIIGWVNRFLVIPTFDVLGKSIANYGLIILLLTFIIKILVAPLTYKSYLSTAKMRLLKPEMDEINEKFPKPDDAMKKQQAMMDLYRRAGVSPMGGCIPMLIQFPVLIAMFRFFPASIELRGQKFLWADDLSSFDSILNLPFDIPFYGSHVSLFALLMAVSVYISSRINYNQTASSAPQMAGMKFMMLYLMPVMLLFWFNNYSSGLSYYYLVSNIITIGQTYAFRYGVSDEKLHARMKENAKKAPKKKKSKWQQRYEDMLKEQQRQARR